jgi:putative methionine-R-sulfoxide reductase with GAF domain
MKQASNESTDLIDVVRSIHHTVSDVVDAAICFFGVYDPARQCVHVVWQVQDGLELPGGEFPLGCGLTSQVIRERQPRLIGHWSHDGPHVQVQYATDRPDLPESGITVPMLFDGQVLGVLAVQSYRAGAYKPEDLEALQRIVARAAPTIAGLLQVNRAGTNGVAAETTVHRLVDETDRAALALDGAGRLVRMNQAARALLSLEHESVLFGFPIDRPQAGKWPLGSPRLADTLRPILDCLEHSESPDDVKIHMIDDRQRLVHCSGSTIMDGATTAGMVVTFELADSTPHNGSFGRGPV